MKLLIAILIVLFASCSNANSQQPKQVKADTTKTTSSATYTDKQGQVHQLITGSRGGTYYMRTSKNGNQYKCYVKL